MRQSPKKAFVAAGVLAIVSVVVALVLAGGGSAASGNICLKPTTKTNLYASCVSELVSPHFLSTGGGTAIAITEFDNQAGSGGATATHVLLSATFTPGPASITTVESSVNGSALSTVGCSQPGNVSSVSCTVGNVSGGGKAVMVVEFTTSVGEQVSGNVQYGEGGGNPSNVPNDNQNAKPDSVTISSNTSSGGNCVDNGTGGSEAGSFQFTTTRGGGASVTVPGDSSLNLPCMPIDAGVVNGPYTTLTYFVEFPLLSTGPATLILNFTPFPSKLKLKTFPIYEDIDGDGVFETVVPQCGEPGNTIPAGSTGPNTPQYDSCWYSRVNTGGGNAAVYLTVNGSLLDSNWHG